MTERQRVFINMVQRFAEDLIATFFDDVSADQRPTVAITVQIPDYGACTSCKVKM